MYIFNTLLRHSVSDHFPTLESVRYAIKILLIHPLHSTTSHPLHQLVECISLQRQSLRFDCFIVTLKTRNGSTDLIPSGISFHILEVNYDNDLVPLNTDFTSLV